MGAHIFPRTTRISTLIILSLAMVLGIFHPGAGHSQRFDKEKNIVLCRGNEFELTDVADRRYVYRDNSWEEETYYKCVPVRMNGEKIYTPADGISPKEVYTNKNVEFIEYVLNGLTDEFKNLPDGSYTLNLSDVVFDTCGEVVFYEYKGLLDLRNFNAPFNMPGGLYSAIGQRVDDLLDEATPPIPAKISGNKVVVRSLISFSGYKIVVKDHKVEYIKFLSA